MKPRPAVLPVLLVAALGCGARPRLFKESRCALGPVEVEIQVVATSRARARRAIDAAFAAISQVNNLLSVHRPESEVSRLNRSSGKACRLSGRTLFVLRRAAEISELSGGAFDVTAGPLIRLWKKPIEAAELLRAKLSDEPPTLPDKAALAAARTLVGYRRLVLGANSATLETPGMQADLGGIAKGYAVDQAIAALKAAGIKDALVDAGGDGYALGAGLDRRRWRVGIQRPGAETGKRLPEVACLSDVAYATSGDYRQYVEIDGVRYAHIIDPRTGEPARKAASVTVIARDCTTADALATALSVLGPDAGLKLIEKLPGVEGMFILRRGGGFHIVTSPGFIKRVMLPRGAF